MVTVATDGFIEKKSTLIIDPPLSVIMPTVTGGLVESPTPFRVTLGTEISQRVGAEQAASVLQRSWGKHPAGVQVRVWCI